MFRRTVTVLALLSMSQLIMTTFGDVGGASDLSRRAPFALRTLAVNGTWGPTIEVPGISQLNTAGQGAVASVSCWSNGNCSAAGIYKDQFNHQQAFVVNAVNGTWGTAMEIPGLGALNAGGTALVNEVSCGTGGNCAAGGYYTDGASNTQAFVVNEVNGTWSNAIEVPGTALLNAMGAATTFSVSCPSRGNCRAGGYYADPAGKYQAFVADEVAGIWSTAIQMPGSALLNVGGSATVFEISCRSTGNCSAGGNYVDASNHQQSLVVNEVNGTWSNAIEVPGISTLNLGGNSTVNNLRCWSAGNCSAVGEYTDGSSHLQAFVANEVVGTWKSAVPASGTLSLNIGGDATLNGLSCWSNGNCSAGGHYTDALGHVQAFVLNEAHGSWGSALEIPGSAVLNAGGGADVTDVSCSSGGNCIAGGIYLDTTKSSQAFVTQFAGGHWASAIETPGTAGLNVGANGSTLAVWCTSPGNCGAGGVYRDASGAFQPFVVNETYTKVTSTMHVSVVVTTRVRGSVTSSSLRFVATGLAASATGTVSFSLGRVRYCSVAVTNGSASCTSKQRLSKGAHVASGQYSGDDAFLPVASSKSFTVH